MLVLVPGRQAWQGWPDLGGSGVGTQQWTLDKDPAQGLALPEQGSQRSQMVQRSAQYRKRATWLSLVACQDHAAPSVRHGSDMTEVQVARRAGSEWSQLCRLLCG